MKESRSMACTSTSAAPRHWRIVLALLLVAPAVPAQQPAAPAASAPAGRELFALHCARCHGAEGTGTANGPDLRERVRGMSEAAFANAVLRRYRWTLPLTGAGGESSAREALVRGTLERRQGTDAMPAWESEPVVAQGIRSLYAFVGGGEKR
jgi:mono/diheme cytochrome c family protein